VPPLQIYIVPTTMTGNDESLHTPQERLGLLWFNWKKKPCKVWNGNLDEI